MPVFNNVLAGASAQATGYTIDQSLRFNDDDSAYLSRTAGTATSNDIGTFSLWTKRGNLGGGHAFFSNHSAQTDRTMFQFDADTIQVFGKISNSINLELITTPVFRDPGAWYHIVIAVDVTQSTASNRVKIYVNGTQITDFGTATYPAQNTDLPLFSKTNHQVGAFFSTSIGDYYDGYLAEYHYIDGQQLAPSSFAETNSTTNQWQAIEYEGSYGNNGFYLKFQDASALGDDSSGNTNDFTVNNLVATDQVLDSPTNTSSNFATLNPLWRNHSGGTSTFSEGNLKHFNQTGDVYWPSTQLLPTTGKWYFECYGDTASGRYGIRMEENYDGANPVIANGDKAYLWTANGIEYPKNTVVNGTQYASGDILGFAVNLDDGEIKFYKNNSLSYTGTNMNTLGYDYLLPVFYHTDGSTVYVNFGQDSSFANTKSGAAGSDFYYTPPTGHKALNTSNIPDPSIADPTAHFNTKLYTGTGSELAVTGLNFSPDFTWIKTRQLTYNHRVFDSVRGVTKELFPNTTGAEGTEAQSLKSFDSDGFTLGTDDGVNPSSSNMVSWNWKAAASNTSVSAGSIDGTNPTIATTRRTNTTAGFSIVSYTGTGANATVAHGLSVAPELVIVKNRDSTQEWPVGSDGIDSGSWAKYLGLSDSSGESGGASRFNSTAPTSTVVSIGTSDATNKNTENHIMYCFHSVDGYSKVGSYTGNGATDGPFVYTGFSVGFLMVKLATAADGQWVMFDNKRDPDNPTGRVIYANLNAISTDVSSYHPYDLLSNGFKSRIPAGNGNEANYNSSGQTYIYLAIAESPQKFSNAR